MCVMIRTAGPDAGMGRVFLGNDAGAVDGFGGVIRKMRCQYSMFV